MKVQNKDNKGNPNHDEEGKFTTADNVSTTENLSEGEELPKEKVEKVEKPVEDNDTGVFVLEFDQYNIDDFLKSIDETISQDIQKSAIEIIDKIYNTDYVNKEFYNSISFQEKLELLKNSTNEYAKDKISNLSEKEVDALIYAESVVNYKRKLEQDISLLEDEREKITKQQTTELYQTIMDKYPNGLPSVSDIWYGKVNVDEYLSKKNSIDENGKNAIDRKREYYEEIINDPLGFIDEISQAQEKLEQLNKFVEEGEKYLALKDAIYSKTAGKLIDLENKISLQREQLTSLNTSEDYLGALNLSTDFIGKYQDKQAAYSQFRKNNAIWFKGEDAASKATEYFGPIFDKTMWTKMTIIEQDKLIDYTGAYSKYNKPLRGFEHYGWSGFDFAQSITNLTNAIDKCVWDEDIWVQRGISDSKMFVLPGTSEATNLSGLNEKELQLLVGTSFKDNGFFSAGAGKGTGFSSQKIIFNTYCPKGTKMAYMNTKGNYKNSDENEMILQRGYSYRITKVEKKGYHIYIDCEVVLGSDDNKITDMNELKNIGKKYLM